MREQIIVCFCAREVMASCKLAGRTCVEDASPAPEEEARTLRFGRKRFSQVASDLAPADGVNMVKKVRFLSGFCLFHRSASA